MQTPCKSLRPPVKLNDRQRAFAQRVASGESKSSAYRKVYNPKATPQRAGEQAKHLSRRPVVIAEIARLRGLVDRKVVLTVTDQLNILAGIAVRASKGKTAGLMNAATRAVDVHAKIAGTMAPVRQELTGPQGGPIPMQATLLTAHMSPREKARALREQLTAARVAPTPEKAAS